MVFCEWQQHRVVSSLQNSRKMEKRENIFLGGTRNRNAKQNLECVNANLRIREKKIVNRNAREKSRNARPSLGLGRFIWSATKELVEQQGPITYLPYFVWQSRACGIFYLLHQVSVLSE